MQITIDLPVEQWILVDIAFRSAAIQGKINQARGASPIGMSHLEYSALMEAATQIETALCAPNPQDVITGQDAATVEPPTPVGPARPADRTDAPVPTPMPVGEGAGVPDPAPWEHWPAPSPRDRIDLPAAVEPAPGEGNTGPREHAIDPRDSSPLTDTLTGDDWQAWPTNTDDTEARLLTALDRVRRNTRH